MMIVPYYQDEWATLYCGDCLDLIPQLGVFDLLLTDPPYGIGEDGGKFRGRKGQGHRVLPKKGWDKTRPSKDVFTIITKAAPTWIIWGGNYFADYVPPSRGWLYWDKRMGGDFSDGEMAYTNIDMPVRSFAFCNKAAGKQHPTQKPVPVMEWCLSFVPQARTVFDPFAGSGTTGVACKRNRRHCTMIERDPDYCAIAAKRLRETQPMMDFDAAPSAYTEEIDEAAMNNTRAPRHTC